MKLSQAVLILSAPSLLSVYADNTPNLCTDDIPNLTKVKPSETASHDIPPITVGGSTYGGDADHFVVRPLLNEGETYKRALIYIPGTTDRPELSSCLIKSAANSLDIPILALSYQYLNSGDKFRNGKCALLGQDEQIVCLEEQHKDAIDGGEYGATHFKDDGSAFWGAVLAENSLKSRLGDLLAYLHAEHPTEGWGSFLEGDSNLPKWENLVVSGHSQGAGHVAYLAKTQQLYGAVMISGPQDECIDCADGTTFWIDEKNVAPGGNTFYSALGHWSEPLFGVMEKNWARMKASDDTINWDSASPIDVGLALETEYADACMTPLVTNVTYASTSTCGGKEHCSTAIDDSVPFTETSDDGTIYLYEKKVWPALMEGADDNNPCQMSSTSIKSDDAGPDAADTKADGTDAVDTKADDADDAGSDAVDTKADDADDAGSDAVDTKADDADDAGSDAVDTKADDADDAGSDAVDTKADDAGSSAAGTKTLDWWLVLVTLAGIKGYFW